PTITVTIQRWQLFAHLQPCLEPPIISGTIGITQKQGAKPAGFSLCAFGATHSFLVGGPEFCPAYTIFDQEVSQLLRTQPIHGA
ncbi:hypothetical protein OA093_00955, partial [bacterium]|nr:hypothetical protein [bacterium]